MYKRAEEIVTYPFSLLIIYKCIFELYTMVENYSNGENYIVICN